ncbi:unnamed protein product [Orchesella dallaii]|uniref:Cytochrome b5 heme-binding domain-containing protein n=1 Tax=Orchesella dallaii TaxID=48710 RepID=A0ABP1RVZ2_9HEXA
MGAEADISGSADGKASAGVEESGGILSEIINEIVSSPINIALVLAILFLVYKIVAGRRDNQEINLPPQPPPLPKLKKRDMLLDELRKYDGTQPDGRVLVAINGKIFDVTRGKRFYGPGGPYSPFAGHDASRALAFFQADLVKEEYDDLSDLDSRQMESVREWEEQFTDKYDFVGRLVKPGEEPTNYSDEEEGEQTEEVVAPTERSKDD